MTKRIELQSQLEGILGSSSVWFQPPESVKLKYPVILYNFEGFHMIKNHDGIYKHMSRYTVKAIDKNPESLIGFNILNNFPYSSFDRRYISDGMVHDVITLYF